MPVGHGTNSVFDEVLATLMPMEIVSPETAGDVGGVNVHRISFWTVGYDAFGAAIRALRQRTIARTVFRNCGIRPG
jgi:hypothetical protein